MIDASRIAALSAQKRHEIDTEEFASFEKEIHDAAAKGETDVTLYIYEGDDSYEKIARLIRYLTKQGFVAYILDYNDNAVCVSWKNVEPVDMTDDELDEFRNIYAF